MEWDVTAIGLGLDPTWSKNWEITGVELRLTWLNKKVSFGQCKVLGTRGWLGNKTSKANSWWSWGFSKGLGFKHPFVICKSSQSSSKLTSRIGKFLVGHHPWLVSKVLVEC